MQDRDKLLASIEPLTIDEFRGRILDEIFGDRHQATLLELTPTDFDAVRALAADKYDSWDWNIGRSPACNVPRAQRFSAGEIDVRIDVQQGRIAGLRFFGDFIGRTEVAALEAHLLGTRYDREAIETALAPLDVSEYFGAVEQGELLALLCG